MKRYVRGSAAESDWSAIQEQLQEDYENYTDPFYELTDTAQYITDLCHDVESEMGLYVEPSVQAGQGGVWIYNDDTNQTLVADYDFQTFDDEIGDIVFEASSADQFKSKYSAYLQRLVDNYSTENEVN